MKEWYFSFLFQTPEGEVEGESPISVQPSDELLSSGHFQMPFDIVREGENLGVMYIVYHNCVNYSYFRINKWLCYEFGTVDFLLFLEVLVLAIEDATRNSRLLESCSNYMYMLSLKQNRWDPRGS